LVAAQWQRLIATLDPLRLRDFSAQCLGYAASKMRAGAGETAET